MFVYTSSEETRYTFDLMEAPQHQSVFKRGEW